MEVLCLALEVQGEEKEFLALEKTNMQKKKKIIPIALPNVGQEDQAKNN